MTENSERMKEEAPQLPEAYRAELARFLIASIDPSEDSEAGAAWNVELIRRVEQSEQITYRLRPALHLLAEIRNKYIK